MPFKFFRAGCFLLLIALFLPLNSLKAESESDFPVLYKGRYRSAEAYARLWLYDLYHSQQLKNADLQLFSAKTPSPLTFLWSLHFLGYEPYRSAPLFWISSAEVKRSLHLPLLKERFSIQELDQADALKESRAADRRLDDIKNAVDTFKLHSSSSFSPLELSYQKRIKELESNNSPKEIGHRLEQEFPLIQRIRAAGMLFQTLPSRYQKGEWFSLKALKVQVYQPSSRQLIPIGNFTEFSDDAFEAIRRAYLSLERSYSQNDDPEQIGNFQRELALALADAYEPLAGKKIQEAHQKERFYPSIRQLRIEKLYVQFPWIPLLVLFYGIGAVFTAFACRGASSIFNLFGSCFIGLAILCHTALLAARSYILERPPVSNMFETVIYVPWIAVCMALMIPPFRKQPLAILAACTASIVLLLIIQFADLHQSLEQVQAVLDSQFWLMIHVLMVVGSYGIFILGAMTAHFYLVLFMLRKTETASFQALPRLILQTLYAGTALLISGTILGGIWAAESWGRFWDWDPKESWAFISSCFYLLWIHAYQFQLISSFGLAFGAVAGLLAISFTWYGVNYILGTGLHSYGFGSGGEIYYALFIGFEILFLFLSLFFYYFRNHSNGAIESIKK